MQTWTAALEIGAARLDAQHKGLFEQAEKLVAAIKAREPSYRLAESFAFLAKYASEHFEAEETLMREVGYPGLASHIEEHREFQRTFDSLASHWKAEGGTAAVCMALQGFLDGWLARHVTDSDQRVGEFLRTH
jgi:hemerythrin